MAGGPVATGSNTTCFPIVVSGIGPLVPSWAGGGAFIDNICFSITTSHPQTLIINLVSPAGTTLLLSSYNGAGGANYVNTCFSDAGWLNINTAVGPCTGTYTPEGGSFSIFDWENPNGTWNLCITDTLTDTTGLGPTTMMASGGMSFGMSAPPPPPCFGMLSDNFIQICQGETTDLTALYSLPPFFNVTWYLNSNFGSPIPPPTAVGTSGSYVITVTDNMGCYDDAFIQVTVSPPIQLGADQVQTACQGVTINLNTYLSMPPGLSLTWSKGGVPLSLAAATNVSQSGIYQLIAQNSSGCRDTVLINLNFLPAPVLGANQTLSICQGATLDLNSLYNTVGTSSLWTYGGAVVPNPSSVSLAGSYTLVAIAANGCTDTALVSLALNNTPSLGSDQIGSFCSNTLFDLTGVFNTTGLTSSWTLSGIPVTTPNGVNISGNYRLQVTDPSGCTDEAFVSLSTWPAPSLGQNRIGSICAYSVVDLDTIFNTNGLSTQWSNAGLPVLFTNNVNISGVYQLVAWDQNSCYDTALYDLTVNAAPALGADQVLQACSDSVVNLNGLYNTTGLSVNWYNAGIPIISPSIVTTSGIYSVIASNAAGCADTASVSLSFVLRPSLGPDQLAGFCPGNQVDLTSIYSAGSMQTNWTMGGIAVLNPQVITQPGYYHLIVTDLNGCRDTAKVQVTAYSSPSLGDDQTHSLCPWMYLDLPSLYETSGLNTEWLFNGQIVNTTQNVRDSGSYILTVTDSNGCQDQAIVKVVQQDCRCDAAIDFQGRCIEDLIHLKVLADSLVLNVTWKFDDPLISTLSGIEVEARLSKLDSITITMDAELSCGMQSVIKRIKLEECSAACMLYVPSAFSPNNDDKNDVFSVYSDCMPLYYHLEIRNRLDQLVFRTNDISQVWDGNTNDVLSTEGLYVYRIEYLMPYQKKSIRTGRLILLR